MKRVFLILASGMLPAADGCATAKSYRALDKDEMEMKPVCEVRMKRFTLAAGFGAME